MSEEIYKTALEDLEKIIAQETSGLVDAIPEQDDRDLAVLFVEIINHDARHMVPRSAFKKFILTNMDLIVTSGGVDA